METELSKKYYRIREVSDILSVPLSTLRYWETMFPQLKPRRNDKGTRYYSPQDMDTLRRIKYLLHDRGLKIEAAVHQMKVATDSVATRQRAIDRMLEIRAALVAMRDSLHRLR